MLIALQVLVGVIIAALGANLFTEAPEDAEAERALFKGPRWYEQSRRASNRVLGILLVALGVATCIDAVI